MRWHGTVCHDTQCLALLKPKLLCCGINVTLREIWRGHAQQRCLNGIKEGIRPPVVWLWTGDIASSFALTSPFSDPRQWSWRGGREWGTVERHGHV